MSTSRAGENGTVSIIKDVLKSRRNPCNGDCIIILFILVKYLFVQFS